jgi:sigma-B regulation protein RsbU (phosphoserine phosphatase)
MLRELIDLTRLEDFVHGLSRAAGLRVCVYDSRGGLIVASPPASEFARLTGRMPGTIPAGISMTPVPAHDPPGAVAFLGDRGLWYVAAPVYVDDRQAGWVSVGEFREESPSGEQWRTVAAAAQTDMASVIQVWERLPVLDRRGNAHAVVTARWGARLLAEWGGRESRRAAAVEETALVGDIAELLTGKLALPAILDRIVGETARVMRCRFCSLRLYDPQTRELKIAAVHNLSPQYVSKGAIVRTQNSIDDEALSGKLVYVEDASTDPRIQYPEKMRQEGIVSLLTAGVFYRGGPIGVIRVYTDHRQRFRQTQRNLLRAVAHQAAIAIVHAQLVEERLRSAKTERQLALAGEVQARMMCIPAPEHPGLETASVYQPTSHLGGDFCDFFGLCDGRLAGVVADVAGKGIPASILSASIRGALRATADCCGDTGEILTRLNRQVCLETRPSEFVTLLLMAVDARRQTVGFASAGHEPLLLVRDGEARPLGDSGIVLGLFPDERYQEQTARLRAGDLLFLHTDGVVDAMNFAGELFGRQRLLDALRQYSPLAVEQVLRNILWDVRRFVGLAEQSDDLTMAAVRALAAPG